MSVLFVQPTIGSELKRKVQMSARRNDVKVKVIEKAGLTMKKALQWSDPYPKKKCGRGDCEICEFGMDGDAPPGECKTRGCVYQLTCREDGMIYRGQTGRSVYERVKEERSSIQKRDEESIVEAC